LLDLDDSEAGRILAQMNVESGYVRNQLQHMLPTGKEPPVVSGQLPMSPKSQRLVTNAIVTAQAAGQAKVSTRFLLAAPAGRSEPGVVCETFRRSGRGCVGIEQGVARTNRDPGDVKIDD
jgi:ATP-dependent Clp protease ATP-binding subunit ClpA